MRNWFELGVLRPSILILYNSLYTENIFMYYLYTNYVNGSLDISNHCPTESRKTEQNTQTINHKPLKNKVNTS